jgi:hypothetical protein
MDDSGFAITLNALGKQKGGLYRSERQEILLPGRS